MSMTPSRILVRAVQSISVWTIRFISDENEKEFNLIFQDSEENKKRFMALGRIQTHITCLCDTAGSRIYTSFKQTVNPSDFGNKRFLLNACLLSRLFQTGKVQTKGETIERNMRWQRSSSKRLSLKLQKCTVRLKEG